MRIAYILGKFPKLSETFIFREIQELERQGMEIFPFSLTWPDDPVEDESVAYAERTIYTPSLLKPTTWMANGYFCLSQFKRSVGHQCRMTIEAFPDALKMIRYEYWEKIARAFARKMQSHRVTCVHAHFAGIPSFVGMISAELIGAKFSFSAHARDIFVRPEMMAWKAQSAKFITTCSKVGYDRLCELIPSAYHYRLNLVHHGIPIIGNDEEVTGRGGTPVILSVCRLEEKKGVSDLLHAAKKLAELEQSFQLVIIGDGSQRSELESLCRELQMTQFVQFLGSLPHLEVQEHLNRASAFAMASIKASDGDRDGIPNVLLEAAGCKVPIAATSVGGIPEFIRQEETGLLSPPGIPADLATNLQRLLTEEALRERLQGNAFQEVKEHFDLSKNATVFRRLFESM